MGWIVEFDPHVLRELSRLARTVQQRILQFLHERIQTEQDPRRLGGRLHGTKKDLWKYRIGDYRVICDIQDNIVRVLILRVGHRREVYR